VKFILVPIFAILLMVFSLYSLSVILSTGKTEQNESQRIHPCVSILFLVVVGTLACTPVFYQSEFTDELLLGMDYNSE
jgi:uncharacterized membrane protein